MSNVIYNACKRTIQRGNYIIEDINLKLDAFVKAELITNEQYEELKNIMEG